MINQMIVSWKYYKGWPDDQLPPWRELDADCMDLIRQLLQVHAAERPTAAQCLQHPFVESYDRGRQHFLGVKHAKRLETVRKARREWAKLKGLVHSGWMRLTPK